jgi:ferric-dicitrate binding protein FerR (iron transport regulator)
MNCEQALGLISARLDRELAADDAVALDQHLAECLSCRATAEAFTLQDQELRQAFEPRRQAAAALARTVSTQLEPAPTKSPARRWLGPALVGGALLAACIAGILLLRSFFPDKPPVQPVPGPGSGSFADLKTLTPKPLGEPAKKPDKVALGKTVETGLAERKRVELPDKSILYVDRDTAVEVKSERRVRVERGNVYVEVAPDQAERFVVETPTREVVAHGTHFEVQVAKQGTGVLVTQGKVEVSNIPDLLVAGQQLVPGKEKIEPAPRTSYLLDWTRDLMDAASGTLVPTSQHAGGTLIARDASGQEAKLSLRKYSIDVHIEDGFARTTIDQTYFNHHPWRLEGTFNFPLPADASLSQLTMYVNGERQEGGMVERQQGRAIYNKIVRSMRDPALLEWVDGTTFKMRVFPLEGRQEKRILLSYTQRLPSLYGRATYRFPSGHSLQTVRDWSFKARVKDGKNVAVICPTHPDLVARTEGNDLVLTGHQHDEKKGVKIDRDVVLHLPLGPELVRGESIEFRHADHDGYRYSMTRFRPELSTTATRQRRDWVFLYEASADRDPLLARVQIEVIRNLLTQAEHDDRFFLVAANSRVHLFEVFGSLATADNIQRGISWLEQTQLVGALDLGAAFEFVASIVNGLENPHLVHLGSGHPGMGRNHEGMKKLLTEPFLGKTRYVGIGVGKRWARDFLKGLAEKTGGLYTQINPDEQVSWRTFELLATLNTPRLLNLEAKFEGKDMPTILVDQAMLSQGEELCITTRVPLRVGQAKLPAQLVITGKLAGEDYRKVIALEAGPGGAGYLPRTWARLEIDRLLADKDHQHKDEIIQLSKDSYVMTPYTSLLVLENEAMYKEFKVEQGRKDHWAAFAAPDKIPVVYEPDATQLGDQANAPRNRKPSQAEILNSVCLHVPAKFLRGENEGNNGQYFVPALQLYRGAFPGGPMGEMQLGRDSLWAERDEDDGKLGELEGLADRPDPAAPMLPTPFDLDAFVADRKARDLAPVAYSFTSNGRAILAGRSPSGGKHLWQLNGGNGLHAANEHFLGYNPMTNQFSDGISGTLELFDTRGTNGEMTMFERRSGLLRSESATVDGAELRPPPIERFESLLEADAMSRTPLSLGEAGRVAARMGIPFRAGGHLRYLRLSATSDQRLRDDLLSYAPGLNTSATDIEAILEAEGEPDLRNAPGHIDEKALKLINKARQGGWMRLETEGKDERGTLLFDPSGRFVVARQLPVGLKEETVCDGATILSLYPEIGLAGQRSATRYHRAELVATLPQMVLPAADLAKGHDLEMHPQHERTVVVVPHNVGDKPHFRQHLVFAEDGSLAERQMVLVRKEKETKTETIVRRQILLPGGGYSIKGLVKEKDKEEPAEKELALVKYTLTPVDAPVLTRDLASLVVLELPLRNRNVLYERFKLDPGQNLDNGANGCYRHLPHQDAVQLLAHLALTRHGDVHRVWEDCFLLRDDLRPGLVVLLAAGNINVALQDWYPRFLKAQPDSPVVRYFAVLHNPVYEDLRTTWPINLTRGIGPKGSFLQRLARFHELFDRWTDQRTTLTWALTCKTHLSEAIAYIKEAPDSILSRTLLVRMQAHGRLPAGGWKALADAWKALDRPGEHYRSQYEQAACLSNAGDTPEARKQRRAEAGKLFKEAAEEAVKEKMLPPLDERFYDVVRNPGPDDPWTKWVEKTAEAFIKADRRLAVLDLANRVRELGDSALAENLIVRVEKGIKDDPRETARVTVAIIDRLLAWNQPDMAERRLNRLLEMRLPIEQNPKAKDQPKDRALRDAPGVQRLAARVAQARGQTAAQFTALERALELEFAHLPETLDLEAWRQDYRPLLEHYRERARVLADLGQHADSKVREDLIRRTVATIDRFRAHDPEAGNECLKAGEILRLLGAEDLAWDYLTTPYAGKEEPSLYGDAASLARNGAVDLADRLYRVACAAEPENTGLVWDRAQALFQAGRTSDAVTLFTALAEGQVSKDDKVYRERAQWWLNNH